MRKKFSHIIQLFSFLIFSIYVCARA